MKTTTRADILTFIKSQGQASPHQLQQHLGLGGAAIHRQLRKLEADNSIIKIGKAPRVVYVARKDSRTLPAISTLPPKLAEVIEARYTYVNPDGVMLDGVEGFVYWVQKTGQTANLIALAEEFVKVRQEADAWYQGRTWIDATKKLRQTFPDTQIDQVAYADFYALPRFGKTKLGAYTLHAKVSQNRSLMLKIASQVRPIIQELIANWQVQALAYIPHSILRTLPFLPVIKDKLALNLPLIKVEKMYAGEIRVAQKSLSKLSDRVENAQRTMFITSDISWSRVLLIDDAVGSGATLNEVAHKLKIEKQVEFVAGFAIVGSYKGFEVISEV